MFSAIFIDRPRLATVIAIVTTIAGLLSLLVIPIAQYPDIVPPQVSVTTTYPGASAAVVEATVAQPIESQVVGVDKMIYMKSVSGNDGSYSLKVSFELGTDPDINTVNVNNRVQVALSKLPEDVRKQGVTVKKQSSALLGVIALYSPKQTHDELFISNYATINLLDQIKSTPGVGDAIAVRPAGLLDARLGAHRSADRPRPDHGRRHQRDPVAERAGGGGPDRRPADLERSAAAAQHPDQGTPGLRRRVRADRDPHQPGRIGPASGRHRPAGTGRRQSRSFDPAERRAGGADRGLSVAGRQRAHRARRRQAGDGRRGARFPGRSGLEGHLRPDDLRHRHDPRGAEDADRGVRPGGARRLPVPGQSARHADPDDRRSGQPDRHVHRAERHRLFGQHRLAAGDRARHRHRRGRCDRRGRGGRAGDGTPSRAVAGEATKMAMGQIFAPIIAITLVLLSVFVPVAFIPGISGELFRQFAVTVAVSMFLSAINALTLSPALCAVLLRPHHGPRRGPIGALMRGIDWVRDGYGAIVARLVRISIIGLVMVASSMGGVWGLGKITPTGFLPEDDQGAFFVIVQLPDGASIGRTTDFVRQIEDVLKQEHSVADYSATIGLNFIDNYSQSNAAFLIVSLKPFEERADASQIGAGDDREAWGQVPPVARRTGRAAGAATDHRSRHRRRIQLRAAGHRRRHSAGAGAGTARTAGGGQPGPQLSRVFSTFSAATPSIYLDIDRDKAQILKVDPSAIFQALQASLGGYYVNDMNLFGRTWQVQVQAEAEDRSSIDDIYRINVRSADRQDDPAAQPGRGAAGDRAAGADPLQQPDRRDGPGQPGSLQIPNEKPVEEQSHVLLRSRAALDRHRELIVIPDESLWADHRAHLHQTTEWDHLPIGTSDVDTVDIVNRRPILGFGLYLHLPGAPEQVYVVDIISAQRSLQCLENGRRLHFQYLRLIPVDIEIDRRGGGREGAENSSQLRILIRSHKQSPQNLRQSARIAATSILQHIAEPTAGPKADDRWRCQRHCLSAAQLAELGPKSCNDGRRRLRRTGALLKRLQ